MLFRHFFTATFLGFALAASAFAQGYVDTLPDEIKNPFVERYKSISKNLEDEPQSNEWVGQYSRQLAPTWSELLVWDQRNGFVALRDTCSNGARAWVNYGGASFLNGALHFSPERNKQSDFVLALPSTEFTPVKWGAQHWLVPSNQLSLFAYAVNSRSDDPYHIAYLKSADTDKSQARFPELPSKYRAILGLPTIKARIVVIGDVSDLWGSIMTIDAGRDRGVIEGMSFWLVGEKGVTVTTRVTEVSDRTSLVKVVESGRSGDFVKEIVPALGWRFTSRVPRTYF